MVHFKDILQSKDHVIQSFQQRNESMAHELKLTEQQLLNQLREIEETNHKLKATLLLMENKLVEYERKQREVKEDIHFISSSISSGTGSIASDAEGHLGLRPQQLEANRLKSENESLAHQVQILQSKLKDTNDKIERMLNPAAPAFNVDNANGSSSHYC